MSEYDMHIAILSGKSEFSVIKFKNFLHLVENYSKNIFSA